MSFTDYLANYAKNVRFEDLPPAVVEKTKIILIDAFACLIGGIRSDSGRICYETAIELGGPQQATLIGSNKKVSYTGAILANQAMIRYLDYNDCLNIYRGPGDLVSSHPSGCLPVAFALAEDLEKSGRALIESVVAAYEVVGRLLDAMNVSLEVRGFHHSATLAYAGAAISGRMMGLTGPQLQNAMGIAGSMTAPLNILDTDGEENVMTRNIVDGLSSERGVLAARLARRGLTGPENIVEGRKGFVHQLLGGPSQFHPKEETGRFYLLDVEIKGICADSTTFGYVTGAASIMREYNLTPDNLKSVKVRGNARTILHCGDPIKKYPRNKESADHSAYFLVAVGILDGVVRPACFSKCYYDNPQIRDLIDRIVLEAAPEFDFTAPACEIVIDTNDGRTLRRHVERKELRGLPERPITENELRSKFIECADGLLKPAQVDRIIEDCLRIEKLKRFSEILPLLRVPKKAFKLH